MARATRVHEVLGKEKAQFLVVPIRFPRVCETSETRDAINLASQP